MSANDLLTELFNVVIKHLQDIMQYDIFVAICAVVIISLTVQAAHWIGLVLNMSVEEKNARSAFNAYRNSRGKWNEPIHRRNYHSALATYEIAEYNKELENQKALAEAEQDRHSERPQSQLVWGKDASID